MSFEIFKANMTLFFQGTNGSASGVSSPADMPISAMKEIPDPLDPTKTIKVLDTDIELAKTAKAIADEYHLAILSAFQGPRKLNPATHSGPLNGLKNGIFLAILAALKVMHTTGAKPSTLLMMPIGAAVVAYWAGTMVPGSFSPLPAPPVYTVYSPGVVVLFPGDPRPIVKGFKNAFSKYDGELDFNIALSKMLDDIIDGFKQHLNTVSGIYFGMAPAGVAVVPVVTPWKGITV